MLRFSEFTNKLYEDDGTATAVQTPVKQATEAQPRQARPVITTNDEKAQPSKTKKELPALRDLEMRIIAIQKKIKDRKGVTGDGKQQQQQQQQQFNSESVQLLKGANFKINDNFYEYNFKNISADPTATIPYFSFTTNNVELNKKISFAHIPKKEYDAMILTLKNLDLVAGKRNYPEDKVISAIKADFNNIMRATGDTSTVGENQVKIKGLAQELSASLDRLAQSLPNFVKGGTSLKELRELRNKVKSEENNIWCIRKAGENLNFNETIKIGDKISLAHQKEDGGWDILDLKIQVNTITKQQQKEATF